MISLNTVYCVSTSVTTLLGPSNSLLNSSSLFLIRFFISLNRLLPLPLPLSIKFPYVHTFPFLCPLSFHPKSLTKIKSNLPGVPGPLLSVGTSMLPSVRCLKVSETKVQFYKFCVKCHTLGILP